MNAIVELRAPSLRERIETLADKPGPLVGWLATHEVAAIAADGDATIAAMDARIQSIQHDHRLEVEALRLDRDNARTEFVVKAKRQDTRIAELEAEVARLSAPMGSKATAWQSSSDPQFVTADPKKAQQWRGSGFSPVALVPEPAIHTLQARLGEAAHRNGELAVQLRDVQARLASAEKSIATESDSRGMFVARLRVLHGAMLSEDVLALLNDCDMLAARSAGTGEAGA